MTALFVCYRREDSAGHAGRVFDKLRQSFGDSAVFLDTSAISPGMKWPLILKDRVSSCKVLVVIIGTRWLSPRLRDENDWVHQELATAFGTGKLVIPVVVDGAKVPDQKELPPRIKPLNECQAIWLDHRSSTGYNAGLERLVQDISTSIDIPRVGPPATLVIRRTGSIAVSAANFKIFLNGERVGEVPNDAVRRYQVPPGNYVLYIEAGTSALGFLFCRKATR
ncbi:MAG: TIR domain-containing protein [Defluviicoccus sp.]|nr:MAG: TIR domain-containing protein [Defluviicoccus sp.]